ncbi:glycosyltransferase, partial [Pseudomonas syringae]
LPWPGIIADKPADIADAAVRLYQEQNLWLEAQHAGQALLQARFQHRQHCATLIERIETLRNGLAEHRLANFTGAMLRHHHHKSTKYMAQWIEAKNRNKDEKPA